MTSPAGTPIESWGQLLGKLQFKPIFERVWNSLVQWFQEEAWEGDTAVELVVVAVLFAVAHVLARWLRGRLQDHFKGKPASTELGRKLRQRILQLMFPLLFLVFLLPLDIYTNSIGLDNDFIDVILNVVLAWIVIHVLAGLLFQPFWARIFAIVVWTVVALDMLGLLAPVLLFLSSIQFNLGSIKISLLSVIDSLFLFTILIRLGVRVGAYFQERLAASGELEPSTRSLLGVIGKIALFVFSAIICLEIFGVDMEMLTVFSGALGLGLGIGLKGVLSNLAAGVVLMLDKAIKVGDVIRVEEVYGEVKSLRALYVLLVTRDGLEYMIPNEDFLSKHVVSSSYTDRDLRLRVPISIAYGSDIEKSMKLAERAASLAKRVLAKKPPQCRLTGLGDSAVNLELRFWISDPESGIGNVKTQVLSNVLKLFKEHGVQIPFPQRDLHIKAMPAVPSGSV